MKKLGIKGKKEKLKKEILIENLEKSAELAFREKEMSLQNELNATEEKLKEIQKNNPNSSQNKTSEQNKAIEEFQNKIYFIRKQLRDVQRQLNADIDKLESNIKLINIWFMPLVVILLYIMIKLFTERQRKDFYKKIGRVEE